MCSTCGRKPCAPAGMKCWNCNKPGHRWSCCDQAYSTTSGIKVSGSGPRDHYLSCDCKPGTHTSKDKCSNCGELYHIKHCCPLLRGTWRRRMSRKQRQRQSQTYRRNPNLSAREQHYRDRRRNRSRARHSPDRYQQDHTLPPRNCKCGVEVHTPNIVCRRCGRQGHYERCCLTVIERERHCLCGTNSHPDTVTCDRCGESGHIENCCLVVRYRLNW